MKILLLNQFFWPDEAATSQLLTDLACHLAAGGHEVTVICGESAYSAGGGAGAPPVEVVRIRNSRFSRAPKARLLSYLSFLAGAAWRGLWVARPDVVVSLTTPPLLSAVGALLKTVRRSRHFIWVMDLYPDVAVDLGVLRAESWVTRIAGFIADAAKRHADGIIALGECMRERLVKRGIPEEKIRVAENWADGSKMIPLPLPDGPFTVLYSGNLGLAHDTDTICGAIERLRHDRRFLFVFIGGGPQWAKVMSYCREREVRNVRFLPHAPREQLGTNLARGHVGLVTQKPACAGSVVPSKVYGLMAARRPVLFIGPREATPARIIEKSGCGWRIDCGDVNGLVSLLEILNAHRELVREAGTRGRAAFADRYDLPQGVSRIQEILCASGAPATVHNRCTLSSYSLLPRSSSRSS